MKKTIRILAVILAAITVIASAMTLVSCGDSSSKIKINPEKEKYVVGICQLVQHDALDAATQGFMDALEAELEKEGREVEFLLQNAQGDSNTCATIINGFKSKDVDLIMANATAALQAAYSGTETIPVLGTSITNYGVALELDNFNGTVGGNISGTCDLADLEKQAQMILDLVPTAKNIGLLYCSAEPNSEYQVKVVKEYLEGKGCTVAYYAFSDTNDLSTVCTNAVQNSDAIYVPTDNTVAANTGIIDNICRPAKVPVVAGEKGICSGCGIAALSISYYGIGEKTGKMAAEVLLGKTDISKLAIAYEENPVWVYNEEICTELGITVPSNYQKIED